MWVWHSECRWPNPKHQCAFVNLVDRVDGLGHYKLLSISPTRSSNMTDHRCKANWVSTPLFGFRFTLQHINMKYEVIKRPLLPTMPIAHCSDQWSSFQIAIVSFNQSQKALHGIHIVDQCLGSYFMSPVWSVILKRSPLIPLKILNRNELTRRPHPSTYLLHSAKKQRMDICNKALIVHHHC